MPEFLDERGRRVDHTRMEVEEQEQCRVHVDPSSTVLELGARYGTVSFVINQKLTDKR